MSKAGRERRSERTGADEREQATGDTKGRGARGAWALATARSAALGCCKLTQSSRFSAFVNHTADKSASSARSHVKPSMTTPKCAAMCHPGSSGSIFAVPATARFSTQGSSAGRTVERIGCIPAFVVSFPFSLPSLLPFSPLASSSAEQLLRVWRSDRAEQRKGKQTGKEATKEPRHHSPEQAALEARCHPRFPTTREAEARPAGSPRPLLPSRRVCMQMDR